MHWVSILGFISIWIIILPIIIGLYNFKKLDTESRIILLVVLAGSIPQLLRPFINNTATLTVLYNLYTPTEFILYLMLFLNKTIIKFNRLFLYFSLIIFSFFSFVLLFINGLQNRFLNEWVIANNILQIMWICLCLREYYKIDDTIIEIYQPFFWFLSGITIYATGTIVFYGLWFFIESDSNDTSRVIKLIHHIFNILLYLFFSIGLAKNNKYRNSSNVYF